MNIDMLINATNFIACTEKYTGNIPLVYCITKNKPVDTEVGKDVVNKATLEAFEVNNMLLTGKGNASSGSALIPNDC